MAFTTFESRAAAAAAAVLLLAGAPAAALEVQPPFDDDYDIYQVNSPDGTGDTPIPGIPSFYAAILFRDLDTLLMSGNSFNDGAQIYTIDITRDAEGHVNGFVDNAAVVSAAPGIPGTGRGMGPGLVLGAGGVMLYTSPFDNSLGMIEPGSSTADKLIDLFELAPTAITEGSALAFVPAGMSGAGRLKLATTGGQAYELTLAPDGSGTFDVTAVASLGQLAGTGLNSEGDTNLMTGLAYVSGGNPEFAQNHLLTSICDYNTGVDSDLIAYEIDAAGSPVIASQRTVVTGLCVTGAAVDPLTGDLLFTTTYGFPGLYVLTGFTVPQPASAFRAAVFKASEDAGSATVSLMRVGSTRYPLTLNYATAAGSAVAGVNYTDVSGSVSWGANSGGLRSFTVPLLDDGRYDAALSVELLQTPATGGAPPPAGATLLINNTDPKPSVSLTSVSRTVDENIGTLTLNAAASAAAGVPITIPFNFTGTAMRARDYHFEDDLAGQPITRIVIPPNATTGSLTIAIDDDTLNEINEKLTANMRTPVNATKGAVTGNTVTIDDDDPLPSVEFTVASGGVTEGSDGDGVPVAALRVMLSAESGREVSVPVTLTGGALDGRVTVASPLVFPAGTRSLTAVLVADDAIDQSQLNLQFTLGTPTRAVLGAQVTRTLNVNDDD